MLRVGVVRALGFARAVQVVRPTYQQRRVGIGSIFVFFCVLPRAFVLQVFYWVYLFIRLFLSALSLRSFDRLVVFYGVFFFYFSNLSFQGLYRSGGGLQEMSVLLRRISIGSSGYFFYYCFLSFFCGYLGSFAIRVSNVCPTIGRSLYSVYDYGSSYVSN